MTSYFDNTGRNDVWTGGVRMIPITTPKGTFNVWTKRVGNNPTIKVLLLHGGLARRTSTSKRSTATSRPPASSTTTTTSSGRPTAISPTTRCALGPAALRRRGRAGAAGAEAGRRQLLPARPLVGRHPRDRVRAQVPAASEGPGHLEHDGEHPGVQRVRAEGADAGDGSGRCSPRSRRSKREGLRQPALHGAADAAPLRAAHPAACRRTSGRIR